MKGKLGAFILVFFLVTNSCMGEIEKKCLTITSPKQLKHNYDCVILNFGSPQYEQTTVIGNVIYPKVNTKACKDFSKFNISFKSKPGELPTFLLVDRGDCLFISKEWNAQIAGAPAVVIADDKDEPLITMSFEDSRHESASIPSMIITKTLGDGIKKALLNGKMRVEYELWTDINSDCGTKCDKQIEFVNKFKRAAKLLEQKGYTRFTPHYPIWYCPAAFTLTKQCKSQCINKGRYCAPDPNQDFSKGYDGKDVVIENLGQLCLFKVANESGMPWVWWDYVTEFGNRCSMKELKFNKECADQVIQSLDLHIVKIDECMGDDLNADVENPILSAEQDAQLNKGSRGNVTIIPTLIINNKIYKGKLEKGGALKGICEGLPVNKKPDICSNHEKGQESD
ncbi:hypothetical protein C5167_002211 [Papaver somniferum]|uniref:Uncharacterized protein n=1 Tax=Papaver somniferum TaxID=3469 RepID=A0A4Y7KXF3_PAPSO|nr:hypothetical protein C5167_002211 [Papaver somniferum]